MTNGSFVLSSEEASPKRSFKNIETWDEILEKWPKVETVQEATGLLYAATRIKSSRIRGPEETAAEMQGRLRFFLEAASLEDEDVSEVAAQLLVKHFLGQRQNMEINGQWYVKVDGMLVTFLREVRDCLHEAPYPRFIGEYLIRVHGIWSTGNVRHRVPHEAYQVITPYLIDALLAWGLAGLLMYGSEEHLEVIEQKIETMMANYGSSGYSFTQALSNVECEPLKVFTPATKEEALRRSALVLLRRRTWTNEFGAANKLLREAAASRS